MFNFGNYLTSSSYFRTIDITGYNCIFETTTTIVIIIITITIMMIIIMMIMIMMMMMIKIIIGEHRGLILLHLLKMYARSKTTGIDRFTRYS